MHKNHSENRVQKDVIIRKNSSKNLLPNTNVSNMPNITNVQKEHSSPINNKRQTSTKLESMDRETANTSKIAGHASGHKRQTYGIVPNSEISSEGGGMNALPSTNNYTTAG